MVNMIHAALHRPERGWDPVPKEHSATYAAESGTNINTELIGRLGDLLKGYEGKRVLDLGAGPGWYSVQFARRGADVTWHDISHNYLRMAREHAAGAGVSINFSIGYHEEAARLADHPFDLVFVRFCWNYSRSDRRFARIVHSLVRRGGVGYVETNTPPFVNPSGLRAAQYWLNDVFY